MDRQYRAYEKDGCIVKVKGKRKKSYYGNKPNVFGTAVYQLDHSSIRKGSVRFHVATWFGVCSYRKLKVTAETRKSVCPICQHDLVKIGYAGVKRLVTDRNSPSFRRVFFEDYEENGHPAWYLIVERRGSDSYEE